MSTIKVDLSNGIFKNDAVSSLNINPAKRKIIFRPFTEPRHPSQKLTDRISYPLSTDNSSSQGTSEKSEDITSYASPDEKEVEESPDAFSDQLSALEGFLEAYFELAKVESEDTEKEITIQFSNLNIKTQQLIRNCIERILVKNDPDLSDQSLVETVNAVIQYPFVVIDHPANWKNDIVVMPTAVIDTHRMVKRMMQKFEKRAISPDEIAQVTRSLDFDTLESDNEA